MPLKQGTETYIPLFFITYTSIIKKMPLKQGTETIEHEQSLLLDYYEYKKDAPKAGDGNRLYRRLIALYLLYKKDAPKAGDGNMVSSVVRSRIR